MMNPPFIKHKELIHTQCLECTAGFHELAQVGGAHAVAGAESAQDIGDLLGVMVWFAKLLDQFGDCSL